MTKPAQPRGKAAGPGASSDSSAPASLGSVGSSTSPASHACSGSPVSPAGPACPDSPASSGSSGNSGLIRVAEVALLSPPFSVLSYLLPPGFPAGYWRPGLRLAVPLGRGLRSAVLLRTADLDPASLTFKLKEIGWPLEVTPLLSESYLDFARQFALRQALPEGRVLSGMLPAGLRNVALRLRFFPGNAAGPDSDANEASHCVESSSATASGSAIPVDYELKQLPALAAFERARLGALWAAGHGRVLKAGESAGGELYSLKVSAPWPVRPSALKQLQLLDYMSARHQVGKKKIIQDLGASFTAVLKQLVAKGLVEQRPVTALADAAQSGTENREGWLQKHRAVLESPPPFVLSADQQAALDDLCVCLGPDSGLSAASNQSGQSNLNSQHDTASSASTDSADSSSSHSTPARPNIPSSKPQLARLLYGVTGSGKTAVYLEFASRVLRAGKSVLILAPEVALALKLRQDAAERFPSLPVHLFHGYQPPAARDACFRELASRKEPALIVGTRSALFLELQNLGAVILDEEHDSSFKQDERINYQAKDLAWFRAAQSGAVLVLGSATPDLKTFYAAEQGHIKMHRLSSRAGGGEMPEVILSPMFGQRNGTTAGGILTDESALALKECVERGDQAVILLNRRGYAPSMFCLGCGATVRCPNCEVSMTYHKKREKLVCHYCGHTVPFPTPCPACKSLHFLPMGEGTEKLEERLQNFLPVGTRVLRLDRDSTGRPGVMEDILRSFGRREADVLVGTQMLSKGHHFPDVTLAVVADGDLGLNMPDYNAAERTFQLLVQASGRSGRGTRKGRVIIQTRDPGHYCWEYVRTNDYEGFYRNELERRQRRRYPPFTRLALVRVSFPLGWPEGYAMLEDFGKRLQKAGQELGVAVLGPAPSPQQMRDRKLRYQCLLKGGDWQAIRGVYSNAAGGMGAADNFHFSLDIDPSSMI